MSDFLLVHGSCHGAWCWRDVIPALEALGHSARAIDLPGQGADTTPVAEITLDLYARTILNALEGPTVVVGHSMAGYPISLAAERDPGRITRLIYLCAYVPADALSLAERRRQAPRQPLLPAIQKTADGLAFTIRPELAEAVFYHDCPPGTVTYANARLGAQAILPQETPVALGANYAGVPRSYIRCNDDRTIPPEFQRTMTADWPAEDVTEMNTGHSPFFAAPVALAQMLSDIARPGT